MVDTLPLPDFEGHKVEIQRIKMGGTVDKDQYVGVPHDGDQDVWFVGHGRLGQIAHKFADDGTIRIEAINIAGIHVQTDAGDTIAQLEKDLDVVESEIRREKTGKATLDDHAAEEAAAAAEAAGGDKPADEVGVARAQRAAKASKGTAKRTPRKSTGKSPRKGTSK